MRRWLPLAAALTLGACATAPTDPVHRAASERFETRQAAIGAWTGWGFTARLSIDDGEEGGSGRLDWQTRDPQTELRFRGALGQGAWQLVSTPGEATLTLANGRIVTDDSVRDLIRRETGWQVPVDRLAWWVRGLPAEGGEAPVPVQLDGEGRPQVLEDGAWSVEYTRWDEVNDVPLPDRLEAGNGQFRIKLAISRWWFNGPDDA